MSVPQESVSNDITTVPGTSSQRLLIQPENNNSLPSNNACFQQAMFDGVSQRYEPPRTPGISNNPGGDETGPMRYARQRQQQPLFNRQYEQSVQTQANAVSVSTQTDFMGETSNSVQPAEPSSSTSMQEKYSEVVVNGSNRTIANPSTRKLRLKKRKVEDDTKPKPKFKKLYYPPDFKYVRAESTYREMYRVLAPPKDDPLAKTRYSTRRKLPSRKSPQPSPPSSRVSNEASSGSQEASSSTLTTSDQMTSPISVSSSRVTDISINKNNGIGAGIVGETTETLQPIDRQQPIAVHSKKDEVTQEKRSRDKIENEGNSKRATKIKKLDHSASSLDKQEENEMRPRSVKTSTKSVVIETTIASSTSTKTSTTKRKRQPNIISANFSSDEEEDKEKTIVANIENNNIGASSASPIITESFNTASTSKVEEFTDDSTSLKPPIKKSKQSPTTSTATVKASNTAKHVSWANKISSTANFAPQNTEMNSSSESISVQHEETIITTTTEETDKNGETVTAPSEVPIANSGYMTPIRPSSPAVPGSAMSISPPAEFFSTNKEQKVAETPNIFLPTTSEITTTGAADVATGAAGGETAGEQNVAEISIINNATSTPDDVPMLVDTPTQSVAITDSNIQSETTSIETYSAAIPFSMNADLNFNLDPNIKFGNSSFQSSSVPPQFTSRSTTQRSQSKIKRTHSSIVTNETEQIDPFQFSLPSINGSGFLPLQQPSTNGTEFNVFQPQPSTNGSEFNAFQQQPTNGTEFNAFQPQPSTNGTEFNAFQQQPSTNGTEFNAFQQQPSTNGSEFNAFQQQPSTNVTEFNAFQQQPSTNVTEFNAFQQQPTNGTEFIAFQPQPSTSGTEFIAFQPQPSTNVTEFNAFQPQPSTNGTEFNAFQPQPSTSGTEFIAFQPQPSTNGTEFNAFQQQPSTNGTEFNAFQQQPSTNGSEFNAFQQQPSTNGSEFNAFQQQPPTNGTGFIAFQPQQATTDVSGFNVMPFVNGAPSNNVAPPTFPFNQQLNPATNPFPGNNATFGNGNMFQDATPNNANVSAAALDPIIAGRKIAPLRSRRKKN
ncbi:9802_t:CDS:2 [Ambispora gerdemannii]|uniref:9802_t:CDS:1 n=1 Tax=Ambispora gerdemannii TaxID=144530 RepID=A0A9N9FF74_9GLOM|nr:9802_t:CDS:2 [Ambispora gerdemannii]